MRTIVFTVAAARQFDSLPKTPREAVGGALEAYAMRGVGDVKKLSGREGFRMRVGDYRVLFDEDQSTIIAIYIGRRRTTTYRR